MERWGIDVQYTTDTDNKRNKLRTIKVTDNERGKRERRKVTHEVL